MPEEKLSYLTNEYLIDREDAKKIISELISHKTITGDEDKIEFVDKFDNRYFGRSIAIVYWAKNFLRDSCFFRGCNSMIEKYFDYEEYFYNEMLKTFFYVETKQGFFFFNNEI